MSHPSTPVSAASLLAAIRSLDLTSLAANDTPDRIRALCTTAREPVPPATLRRVAGNEAAPITVAAVCVYPFFLPIARQALQGSGVRVAVVAAGFPAGLSPLRQRIDEIRSCVAEGADEIDAVINRSLALTGEWEVLHDEVAAFREAAGAVPLKMILATGELVTDEIIARAARTCLEAGADFLKTSTGHEVVNATYPAGEVMLREIERFRAEQGRMAGFKASGGIRTAEQALKWRELVGSMMGEAGLTPSRFRIGASGLLQALVDRLETLPTSPPPSSA